MRINDLDALRNAVRQERRRRKLSQEQLAGMSGYSRKWLSDFERGAVDPPASMVLRLALLLGMALHLGPTAPVPSRSDTPPDEIETDIDGGL